MRRRPVFTIVAKRAPVWAIQFPARALAAKAELFCMIASFLAARLCRTLPVRVTGRVHAGTHGKPYALRRLVRDHASFCAVQLDTCAMASVNHSARTLRLLLPPFHFAQAV